MNSEFKLNEQLNNEYLESEKIRLSFIAGISLLLLFTFWIVTVFNLPSDYFHNDYKPIIYSSLLLIALFLREILIIKFALKKFATTPKRLSILRYGNMAFEISVPSLFIIIFQYHLNNVIVLNSPAVAVYFLVILLSVLSLDIKISIFAGVLASVQYLIITYFTLKTITFEPQNPSHFLSFYIGRTFSLFLAGILAGYIGYHLRSKIVSFFKLVNESSKIREIFGQQISSEIVNELIEKRNHIATEKKFVAIMFVDIRNFTPFAETKSPEEIIDYQNRVFGFMADIIIDNNGVINQFLGDGYMATFGAPISKGNDCQNAVNAALNILEKLHLKNKNNEIPFTRIGIGIHAGDVVTGNVGSENRKQYSISGNTVIIASRIEQLTKEHTSQLIISEEVITKLENCITQFELIGPTFIKGRTLPIKIYKHITEN